MWALPGGAPPEHADLRGTPTSDSQAPMQVAFAHKGPAYRAARRALALTFAFKAAAQCLWPLRPLLACHHLVRHAGNARKATRNTHTHSSIHLHAGSSTHTRTHQQGQDLVEQRPRAQVARLVSEMAQRGLALRGRAILDLEQQLHDLALLGLLKTQLRLVHILLRTHARSAVQCIKSFLKPVIMRNLVYTASLRLSCAPHSWRCAWCPALCMVWHGIAGTATPYHLSSATGA